jgi:drug/metabolite transporter (DMT)-like permease
MAKWGVFNSKFGAAIVLSIVAVCVVIAVAIIVWPLWLLFAPVGSSGNRMLLNYSGYFLIAVLGAILALALLTYGLKGLVPEKSPVTYRPLKSGRLGLSTSSYLSRKD